MKYLLKLQGEINMYKTFIGFVKKEFYHIFRDKKTLLILFGIPAVQILLFGFAITNEIKDVNIAILDYSKDYTSNLIIKKLTSTKYFNLKFNLTNENQIEQSFKTGKIKEVLVFEKDFGDKLIKSKQATIQLITDGTDANAALTIINYTTQIINQFNRTLNENTDIPLKIIPEVKMRYNPELKGVFLSVPGLIAVILMLISALMTSISITREKETGSMELLLVSPIKPVLIIIAKVIPYAIIGFLITILILVLGTTIFSVPIKGNIPLLLLENIFYIILSLSLGILISTIAQSQLIALMISLLGLMMPTVILSGFIYPIENMPIWIQPFTYIIPARWFIVIIKNIMLKGSDFTTLWKETLIIIAMIFVFITISVKKYKIRL
jgi:ABC-2 type transport system permease protein